MRQNVGRPPKWPASGEPSSITIKIPSEFKQLVLIQAKAYGMTITEYLRTLVEHDAERDAS